MGQPAPPKFTLGSAASIWRLSGLGNSVILVSIQFGAAKKTPYIIQLIDARVHVRCRSGGVAPP